MNDGREAAENKFVARLYLLVTYIPIVLDSDVDKTLMERGVSPKSERGEAVSGMDDTSRRPSTSWRRAGGIRIRSA